MPSPIILKNYRNSGDDLDLYILKPARELKIKDETAPPPKAREASPDDLNFPPDMDGDLPGLDDDPGLDLNGEADGSESGGGEASGKTRRRTRNAGDLRPDDSDAPGGGNPEDDPFQFAKVQKEALLKDAKKEVEAYKAEALEAFEAELAEKRKAAREDGYRQGFTEGMADAMAQAKIERDRMAEEQIKSVEEFLTAAARARDQLLDDSREEMKELSLAIAEKIIQISLKNSGDIILRMVEAATDTHKKCEWAHIYIADCDIRGKAYTVPELAAALSHISDRVRVIPMADDESGTCIVELPDVIYDASVSTQLSNIKEVLDSAGPD